MNTELGALWKERVLLYFEIIIWIFRGYNYDKPETYLSVCRPSFEQNTSEYKSETNCQ
jgi:hypothetical protein